MKTEYIYFVCYEGLFGKNYKLGNLIYKTTKPIRNELDFSKLKQAINKVIPGVPINIVNFNLLSKKNIITNKSIEIIVNV